MKVVLTGGCTGGHIYPALSVGDKFREENPQNEVIYIGHEFGMETLIVPNAGYEFKIITADWLRRDNPIRMFKTLLRTQRGKREAIKILKKFEPDIVVSTGSFVSVPVILAAHSLGIPIYIHEQNGFPGISNKAFARWAKLVFLGFESARTHFKIADSKIIYSGNPVRKEFYNRNSSNDRKKLGLSQNDTIITIFGGSLGSETTNKIGESLIKEYGKKDGFVIIFGTGRDYYDEVEKHISDAGFDKCENVRIMPYISNMPEIISASDLVVSRAGALSVAEVTMVGRAAIFIPSPNVTADHQYYNAKSVEDIGGAIIIREDGETATKVLDAVKKISSDRGKLEEMGKLSGELAPKDASKIIYNHIMETFK